MQKASLIFFLMITALRLAQRIRATTFANIAYFKLVAFLEVKLLTNDPQEYDR